jgi:hypothetical protein
LKVALLSATTTFACLKIKSFEKQDGGSSIDDTPMSDTAPPVAPEVRFVDDSNGGGTVTGPDFFVRFGSGSVAHYPDRLQINGVEVLGHDGAVACNAEDQAGIALFPAQRAAVLGATPISTNLIAHLTGPAVVKLEVFSVLQLMGSDASGTPVTRTPTLRSRYTFHPDGKTFRYDTVDGGTGSDVTTASINCASMTSTQFVPTSFTTLRADGSATLYRGANSLVTAIPGGPGSAAISDATSACIDYGQQQVAFAWNDTFTRIRAPSTTTLAFVYDFDRAAANAMGSANYWTRSAMFLGRANSCTATNGVHDLARRWRDTHELIANGVSIGIANDGIFGGESDPGNQIGINLPLAGLTVTGDVPMPFAMWLTYAPGTNGLVIEKTPAPSPPFYQIQKADGLGEQWVIWFRDPITTGQTISIRPQ